MMCQPHQVVFMMWPQMMPEPKDMTELLFAALILCGGQTFAEAADVL